MIAYFPTAHDICQRSLAADRGRKNHPQFGRKLPLTVKPASNEHFSVFSGTIIQA